MYVYTVCVSAVPLTRKGQMQFLTAIIYFGIQIFMPVLLVIAGTHSSFMKKRSSIGVVGCYYTSYLSQNETIGELKAT